MASGIIQNWVFAEQKTVAATISIHTHTHIHPHTFKNSSDFGHYKIQIHFQKYFFQTLYTPGHAEKKREEEKNTLLMSYTD